MENNLFNKMIENLKANTGKTLEQWIEIASQNTSLKHKEQVQFLQKNYELGLNYADLIVHKTNKTDSGSQSHSELIENQYKGKENLKSIYDALIKIIQEFDGDFEIAPKKAYVSLKRKKQFACLKPATKTRFELELIIKNQEQSGILETITSAGAMCTHKIKLENENQITDEVIHWLKISYGKSI